MSDDLRELTRSIAKQLGEFMAVPNIQIRSLIEICGLEFTQDLLNKTFEIEEAGGMMLPDNSRRRTIGGVFFHLARQAITLEQRNEIFPTQQQRKKKARENTEKEEPQPLPPMPSYPAFDWENRMSVINVLLKARGEATTVKITLIGRPGQVENRDGVVVTTMQHTAKTTTYPKGIPAAPDTPTLYTVYISSKQWRKVEEAIANPEDAMIVEGTCAFDPAFGGISVYAQSITTKLLEAQKRQAQKEAAAVPKDAAAPSAEAPEQPKAPPPQPKAQQQPKPAETKPAAPKPPAHKGAGSTVSAGIPQEVTQKLNELYASAALFRQKISTIQAKPAGQQFGLEMTQKLLKNVEDEIATLETKYSK